MPAKALKRRQTSSLVPFLPSPGRAETTGVKGHPKRGSANEPTRWVPIRIPQQRWSRTDALDSVVTFWQVEGGRDTNPPFLEVSRPARLFRPESPSRRTSSSRRPARRYPDPTINTAQHGATAAQAASNATTDQIDRHTAYVDARTIARPQPPRRLANGALIARSQQALNGSPRELVSTSGGTRSHIPHRTQLIPAAIHEPPNSEVGRSIAVIAEDAKTAVAEEMATMTRPASDSGTQPDSSRVPK